MKPKMGACMAPRHEVCLKSAGEAKEWCPRSLRVDSVVTCNMCKRSVPSHIVLFANLLSYLMRSSQATLN